MYTISRNLRFCMQIRAVDCRVAISYIYLAFNEDPTIPVSVAVFANGAARLLKPETTEKPPSHSFSFKVHMKNGRWKGGTGETRFSGSAFRYTIIITFPMGRFFLHVSRIIGWSLSCKEKVITRMTFCHRSPFSRCGVLVPRVTLHSTQISRLSFTNFINAKVDYMYFANEIIYWFIYLFVM